MSHFDIVRQSSPAKSFRVASVMGTYDLQTEHISERFVGDIDLPEKWNVGLIVGRSGTGKTTIATELFGDKIYRGGQNYTHECLLDDFPASATMSEIYQALTAVGFASPPDWLKSYHVLSNGEKLQVRIEQEQRKEKEKTRDNIIRIVCALVSSGAEYDTYSDAIDEAIGLYNEINERI